MEEKNIALQRDINDIQKKDKVLKHFNLFLVFVIIVIAIMILIHKLYLKENMYSLITNNVINSVETVEIEQKGSDKSTSGEEQFYIVFSNSKIKNKIYVNKGAYDNCSVGDKTTVNVKDVYDKKGNILKEELLFDIID